MKSKVLLARIVVATLLLAVILAGCGSPATPAAPTPAPATPVPATPVPPTAAPPTAVPPTAAPPTAAVVTPSATADDPTYYEGEPVAVVPAGIPGQPMITAAYNTAIRSGPGTNYVVYSAFLGSQTAQAVGVSADGLWWVISVPVAPGGTGWVDAAYALAENTSNLPVVQAPPVPPTVELVPPGPDDPQATALTEVYVRNGPGTQYPAYGIAVTGANARVIGKSTDGLYLVVRLNPQVVGNGYGWVDMAYTQPANIESVPVVATPEQAVVVPPPPPPSSDAPSATALDFVNVRSGPGTNYLILGVASPGATAEVSGKSEDGAWWQVKIPVAYALDGFGWVSADWVTTSNTGSIPVAAAPEPPPAEVSTTPPPAESCTLVSQNPADNTTFPTSTGFGVQWVLENTGTTAWTLGETDIVFQGAIDDQRLHQNYDVYDIPYTVNPGETLTLDGSLITPAEPGQYGEGWAVQQGANTIFCTFWIVVNVE